MDTLSLSGCNSIVSVQVPVTIYHTYQGDLIIDLISPSGTSARLWTGSLGMYTNNVITTFTTTAFNGQPGSGTWPLSVYDQYYQDSGTLSTWGVNLTCN